MILEGSIRLPFTYAAGAVGSRFLVALRDAQAILGGRCPECETVSAPARSICPECGTDIDDLVEVGPGGRLEAWTAAPGKPTFGLIRLDGAGTALVHRLLDDEIAWEWGARVIARFADEQTGSINDIEGFEHQRGAS